MFSALTEGIAVRDPDGELVYANESMLRSLGYDSIDAARGQAIEDAMANFIVMDEHGRPIEPEQFAGVKMAHRGTGTESVLMQLIRRDTGELAWWRVTARPLNDHDGNFLGAMVVTEDITAAKINELRVEVLAQSGELLASSLDYEQTLRNVAEVAVTLADYCSVDLVDDRGGLRRMAAVHRVPARRHLMEKLGGLPVANLPADHPVIEVLTTNAPQLFAAMDDDSIRAVSRDENHYALLKMMGVQSMLIVPLRVPSHTMGVMTIAVDVSRRRLTSEDVALGAQLGRRAAVAVENSRLHTKLAGIAETLQRGLLPAELPQIPGWEVASLYRPAATEFRVDVGGDFYEVFEAGDGEWFAILGDVLGKGVGAASVTLLARHGARVAAGSEPEPVSILQRLDEALGEQPGMAMATAVCMRLHDDQLTVSSAGHPPIVIIGADGHLQPFPVPDPMLGAFANIKRHQQTLEVSPGDLIVAYTDGVTEALGHDGRFGADRLMQALRRGAADAPRQVLDRITMELSEFGADSTADDVAMLAMRRTGG
jgi:PAS domain S-box-containing protein